MSNSYVAGGAIKVHRFVKSDPAADNGCLQAAAGDVILGIAQEGTKNMPYSNLDNGDAAVAKGEIQVYSEGDICLLCAGAAFPNGAMLKADVNGKGIVQAAAGDKVGARALQQATAADQLVRVLVTIGRLS